MMKRQPLELPGNPRVLARLDPLRRIPQGVDPRPNPPPPSSGNTTILGMLAAFPPGEVMGDSVTLVRQLHPAAR